MCWLELYSDVSISFSYSLLGVSPKNPSLSGLIPGSLGRELTLPRTLLLYPGLGPAMVAYVLLNPHIFIYRRPWPVLLKRELTSTYFFTICPTLDSKQIIWQHYYITDSEYSVEMKNIFWIFNYELDWYRMLVFICCKRNLNVAVWDDMMSGFWNIADFITLSCRQ